MLPLQTYQTYEILIFIFMNVFSRLVYFLLMGFPLLVFPQRQRDSLWKVWNDTKLSDTLRIKAIHFLATEDYFFNDKDSAIILTELEYKLAEKGNHLKHMSNAMNTRGVLNIYLGDFKAAIHYLSKGLELRKKINDKKGMASSYKNLGNCYKYLGNTESAITSFNASIKLLNEIGDDEALGSLYSILGSFYSDLGNMDLATDYLDRSLHILEKSDNSEALSDTYNNAGILHKQQGNITKAYEYYQKSLDIARKNGAVFNIINALINLGGLYQDQGIFEKAIEYYNEASALSKKHNEQRGLSVCLNNIGSIYNIKAKDTKRSGNQAESKKLFEMAQSSFRKSSEVMYKQQNYHNLAAVLNNIGLLKMDLQQYDSSAMYIDSGLVIRRRIGDKRGLGNSLNSKSELLFSKQDWKGSIHCALEALELGKQSGSIKEIKESAFMLFKNYKASGDHARALEMFEMGSAYKDSLEKLDYKQELIRQEFKHNYEKKVAEDSIKQAQAEEVSRAQIEKQNAQLEKRQTQLYAFIGGTIILLVFIFLLLQRFRITDRQKKIIEKQKQIVEHKNNEITSSITYAKRIQAAILPPAKYVKEVLPDSFVVYVPKDIVAGDFYWVESDEEHVLFAAADCTGHGVPGAMVSMICNNALNKCVKELSLRKPWEILDEGRNIILREFEKSEEEVKDGMDISLCSISFKTNKLLWAGANNPLWIIRKGELLEYKGDKQPVGRHATLKPFTPHEITLESNDLIYIFTDGYSDQFGGSDNKKFKASRMKELLLSICHLPMPEQEKAIISCFENWKGKSEQVDDICIVGVRI